MNLSKILRNKISAPVAIGTVILVAILAGGVLVWQYWLAPKYELPLIEFPLKSEKKVTITTDKTEYGQGKIVKITVKNNADEEKKICSPFYIVENFDGRKWIEIKKALCPCEVVCRLATYLVLQPNKPAEYEWNQKEEWCGDPSMISTTISNQVPPGRYRVKSYIGAMKGECKETYSNEFTIKEK